MNPIQPQARWCPKCKVFNPGENQLCVKCGASMQPPQRKKGPSALIWWCISGIALVIVLIGVFGSVSNDRGTSASSFILPDASRPFGAARTSNTRDEYTMMVARYGKPDSILSTERDSPKPKVPSRTARFKGAHVIVAFVPNGCVEAYEKAMKILAEAKLSKIKIRKMGTCVPSADAGWTIVGYLDLSDNRPISAQQARTLLDKITVKRTAEPVEDTEASSAQWAAKQREEAVFQLAVHGAKHLSDSMRNPDSFKLAEVLMMDNGAVCYTYRAQNGFGGMNVGSAVLSRTGQFRTNETSGFHTLWNKECANKTGKDKTWAIGYAAGFHGILSGN
jgi:hypothetical protein